MGSIFSQPKAGEKTVFGVNLSDFELVLGVIWGDPKNGPKNISGHKIFLDIDRSSIGRGFCPAEQIQKYLRPYG